MERLPRFAGFTIFALAMAVLVLEVALTRVFSVITFHHFTYLIIGLALLGFGAAGTVLTVSPRFQDRQLKPGLLADCVWLFGLMTMICFLSITRVRFDAMEIHLHHDFAQLFGLLMLLVLAATPFFVAGLCIGYLISKSGEQINRLYFSDLTGAGCGSLGSLLAINYLGATNTIFWISLAACLVAMLITGRRYGGIRWRYPLTAVVALGLALVTLVKDSAIPVPFPQSKLSGDYHGEEYRWHVVARIDVTGLTTGYPGFGGSLSRVWDESRPPLEQMHIVQDGAAPTGIVKLEGHDPRDEAILGYYMQAAPYVVRPAAEALVIGAGGGVDVAIALHHGGRHVTAVDINPWIIDYVQNRYNDFAGGLYRRDDVDVVCAEGRHYLTATDKRFDVIQLSGVDTFSALASGAYALTENYLYTREALSDFLDHLTEDGVLCFSRWLFTPPRETLRLAVTARAALEARGTADASRHILVLAAPAWEGRSPWAETMIKLEPFTRDEVAAIRTWARKLRFDLIYDPLLSYEAGGPYDALESTSKYKPQVAAQAFNSALRLPKAQLDAFLADYPHNVTPTTDDAPFFFNYYRLKNLRKPFTATLGGDPVTRLPLGLMILIACLLQIVILGGLFIFLPMRSHVAGLREHKGLTSVLAYFACIGLGFIAVEIMLLQKLMVFLGGPVYSMAITLFSLLVFCGVGSFLSKRITRANPRISGIPILLVLAGVLYATLWFLDEIVPTLMGLSHTMRCLVAVAGLLPIGLMMGMPFPAGIRMAERLHAPFVPWAWCVNACATVLGSVGCILVAMFIGFTNVLLAGLILYLAAVVALLLAPPSPKGTAADEAPETPAPAGAEA
ncbi:MAG: class I SAM-dependent methyltransferase [Phycisphaerae bacterium]|nr:class I SAM-dependent methyltransferase [Phycisphaerae bacterium]